MPPIKAKSTKTKPATKPSNKTTTKPSAKLMKRPGALKLTLPATSANLGPAFDAAALALDINFEIAAKAAKEYSIEARGRDTAICSELKDNLIVQTYENVLRANGRDVTPLAFS